MFTQAELLDAIDEINKGKHTIQNCGKLASIYTVLDHLYGAGYSADPPPAPVLTVEAEPILGVYGDSDFLKAVATKNPQQTMLLINELMDAISVLNPKIYNSFMARLESL